MQGPSSACAKCGRSLRELRRDLTADAMRGSAPLCAVPACPVIARLSGFASLSSIRGRELEGPAPGLFVGRKGYPVVATGPLVPPASAADPLLFAHPSEWLREDVAGLVALRGRLLRTRAPVHVAVRSDPTRTLEAAREAALSERPVETALTLTKEPRFDAPRLDGAAPPMGPGVEVEKARVVGRAIVPRRVDALVSDVHAPTATAVAELAEAGIDGYHIERLLAAGLIGERDRRKLVPTRWAITATDDMLSRAILDEVRALPDLGEIRVHEAERLGNRFHVVLLPGAFAFEMAEAWRSGEGWQVARDAEGPRGRSAYVEEVAGAYYAARLAAAEHLRSIGRRASVVACREITEDYWAPLGVWVVRETARVAFASKPLAFGDVSSVVRHLARRSGFKGWGTTAKLLRDAGIQRRLSDFAG